MMSEKITNLCDRDWRSSLSDIVTDIDELITLLDLDVNQADLDPIKLKQFPLRVPREFVSRMRSGDWHDPLLLQVLPTSQENKILPGFSVDPLGESQSNPIPGLLHKYKSRVLLTIAGDCPIHCRYCFRRSFAYEKNSFGSKGLAAAIQYIMVHPEINEVILSGGEPLLVSDEFLNEIFSALEKVDQIKRLRIHTRMPIVTPSRVTDRFCEILKNSKLKVIVAFHCNHANEIDESVAEAIQKLQHPNITLLNQTVLLKDINNTVSDLKNLSERLFDVGIMPYYLHLLDPVQGAAHFDVVESEAKLIMQQLARELPGFLLPKLVREVSGELSKMTIS